MVFLSSMEDIVLSSRVFRLDFVALRLVETREHLGPVGGLVPVAWQAIQQMGVYSSKEVD